MICLVFWTVQESGELAAVRVGSCCARAVSYTRYMTPCIVRSIYEYTVRSSDTKSILPQPTKQCVDPMLLLTSWLVFVDCSVRSKLHWGSYTFGVWGHESFSQLREGHVQNGPVNSKHLSIVWESLETFLWHHPWAISNRNYHIPGTRNLVKTMQFATVLIIWELTI